MKAAAAHTVGAAGLLGLLSAGCGSKPPAALPPAPEPAAPLAIDVVYPVDSQWVAARESTFLFGNVNDPAARLFVGGAPVALYPNGAFLAWTFIPRAPGDTSALFEVMAVSDGDTARAQRWVRVPKRPPDLAREGLAVDTASVEPRGIVWALPHEPLRFSVRATAGAVAWLEWPGGERFSLVERREIERAARGPESAGGPVDRSRLGTRGGSVYVGTLAARSPLGRGTTEPARVPPPPPPELAAPPERRVVLESGDSIAEAEPPIGPVSDTAVARDSVAHDSVGAPAGSQRVDTTATPSPPDALPRAVLALARGADTLRVRLALDLWIVDPARPPVVAILDPPNPQGTDGVVYGRPTATGTYVWLLHDGQRLPVSGREGDRLRVRLGPELDAWIDLTEQVPLPEGTPPPRTRVRNLRMVPQPDGVDVRVSLSERVPYLVTEDGRRLELTLYSAYAETDWVYYGEARSYVRAARWRQGPGGIFVLTLELEDEPWGYRVGYAGGSLVLSVRRPPPIDPRHPLRGRRIAVDPGHPPAGARGPTRLYEGDVNLAVSLRLKALLEERGAEVFLTRTSETDSVPLYARPLMAESAGAEILVSIHNNALPDGVRPFDRHGTSVFYFHPHSLDLARALQENLLRTLGLNDLGIGRANLALARSTWMPSALTEGAFMMIPAQETLLRTPGFQERYARGVLRGIEEFLSRRTRRH